MNKIEDYLNKADKRQRYLIYFMLFGLIFYIFFQIMSPMKESDESLRVEVDGLQSKLARNSLKRLKRQRDKRKKELLELKTKMGSKKEYVSYLVSQLYKLKYAFYDDKEWAKSINDILHYSVLRNLQIDYIKSYDVKKDGSKVILKKRKSLEIGGSGSYIDIVAFVSYIDNLNRLLKFQKMQLLLDDKKLKFKLIIDMYGIGL